MPSHAPIVTRSRFTAARGCVSDVARLAHEIPLFPVERTMPLGPLAAARAAVGKTAASGTARIGWAAVFLKAYALVSRETPMLRTWLVRGLFGPRLATAAESVAVMEALEAVAAFCFLAGNN